MKSKNVSDRTKQVKRRAIIFGLLSTLILIGVVSFTVISAFSKVTGTDKTGTDILSEALKAQIISLSVTAIICLLLAFVLKDKMRYTLYLLSLFIITFLYKNVGMYIVGCIWAVDEYIIYPLYKRNKSLILINKEIDRRD